MVPMDEPIKLEDLRATVHEAKSDLARTLRAMAHPKRLEILGLLTDTTKSFVDLLKATQISRTALANHLQQLITRGLIIRLERGSYQITKDGQELLQAIVESYVDSQIRLSNGWRHMIERYAKTRTGMGRKMKKLQDLKFKDYAVSHLGALHGCLEYLDVDISQPWLYGITAHGLIINISSKDICPSGPTAWKPMPVFLGAKNLGVNFEGVMAWPNQVSQSEYLKKLQEAWTLVTKAITNGRPCYGWQIGDIADFYTIYGVDDIGYYYKGYFQEEGAGPKPWKDIGKMFIEVYRVERTKTAVDDTTQVKNALQWALRHAANDKEWIFTPKYQAGLSGFDAWIDALEKGTALQFGHAYNTMVWRECRQMANQFFIEAKARLNGEAKPFLAKAAELYGQVADQLLKVAKLYPFDKDKLSMDPIVVNNTSQKAVQHLKAAREAESQGLKSLQKIIEAL
jgi:DNA-binding HxlR family transcriptional regulator